MPPTQSEEVNVLSTELSTDYSIPLPSAAQAVGGLTDQRPYHFLALWGNVFLPYLYLQYLSLEREVLYLLHIASLQQAARKRDKIHYSMVLRYHFVLT